MQGRPLIIAHRGLAARVPENTLAAFAEAAAAGADMWELDLRRCADGALVAFHDPTTARLERPGRALAALGSAELLALELGGGQRIPTLDQVCELASRLGCGVNLELKEAECEQAVADTLARHGLGARALLAAFDPAILEQLRRRAPDLPRALLSSPRTLARDWPRARLLELLARLEATAWHPHQRLLRLPGLLEAVRAAGYQVHPWTVNHAGRARQLVARGASGLITDTPAQLRAALTETAG